jgi:hypothetical protein
MAGREAHDASSPAMMASTTTMASSVRIAVKGSIRACQGEKTRERDAHSS